MAASDPITSEPRAFLIRPPRPLWIGVATGMLIVVAVGLRYGLPIYRQRVVNSLITQEFAETKAIEAILNRSKLSHDQLRADSKLTEKAGDHWRVWIWRRPPTPGGHYVVLVTETGEVTKIMGGK